MPICEEPIGARHQHLLLDQIIELKNEASKEKYPKLLRRLVIWDEVNQQKIELITILILKALKALSKYNWHFPTWWRLSD